MRFRIPVFAPDRWNNLNTTVAMFLFLAVVTAFTVGVILGLVLLCAVGEKAVVSDAGVQIIDKLLWFLAGLWTIEGARFGVKRKTHQPGGSADAPGPGGRPSTAGPAEGAAG